MSYSVRGVARRYRSATGNISVRQTFRLIPFPGFPTDIPSLRTRLRDISRTEVSFSVSECVYGWTARYEQRWSRVIIRIRLNPDSGISAQTMANLRTTWENGIETTWNNQWAVGRPGEIACPLEFDVQWVTSGQHHTVRVRPGPERSNMTTWDTSDGAGTAAHEFGHMFGNPDEYSDSNCPNRNPVNTGTVMDNNSNNVPARLMTRLATNLGSNVVPIP